MSPEVLQNESHYNEKSDLWSVGIIIYQMIEGITPFDLSMEEKQ